MAGHIRFLIAEAARLPAANHGSRPMGAQNGQSPMGGISIVLLGFFSGLFSSAAGTLAGGRGLPLAAISDRQFYLCV